MTVRRPDRLNFLFVPPKLLDDIFSVMTRRWEFVNETVEQGEHVLRFRGKVFPQMTNSERTLKTDVTIFEVIKCLRERGWGLVTRTNLQRHTDMNTYVFARLPQASDPHKPFTSDVRQMICICNRSKDWVYLTKPAANELRPFVNQAAKYGDDNFTENSSVSDYENSDGVQMHLYKNAWVADEEIGVNTTKFLVEMFYLLETHGYQFYGAADTEDGINPLYFAQQLSPVAANPGDKYWVLTLAKSDRMRISGCSTMRPEDLVALESLLRSNITAHWSDGISGESEYFGAFEFQLKGTPWSPASKDTVFGRVFLTSLYEDLLKNGWGLHASLSLFPRKMEGRLLMVFKSVPPRSIPHICIGLSQSDKLRMIHCGTDIVNGTIRPILMRYWPGGIQSEADQSGSNELKLKGNPWKQDSAQPRSLIAALLSRLASAGWVVISSTRVSRRADNTVLPNNLAVYNPVYLHSIWLAKFSEGDGQTFEIHRAKKLSAKLPISFKSVGH